MIYHRVCNYINTAGATSGAGTAYPSGAHEFTPGFLWGSFYSIVVFLLAIVLSVLRFMDSDYPFAGFDINFLTNLSIQASAILILHARNCKLLARILKCHICM